MWIHILLKDIILLTNYVKIEKKITQVTKIEFDVKVMNKNTLKHSDPSNVKYIFFKSLESQILHFAKNM